LAVVLVLVIMLAAGGVWWWHSFNGANEGIIQSPILPASAEVPATYGYKTLVLNGAEIQYPEYYNVQQNAAKVQGLLDYRLLTGRLASSDTSSQIGITLKPLTAGSVQEDSNYRYYVLKADQYTKDVVDVDGATVSIFKKKADGFEQVLFVSHNGKVLIINLSAATADDANELSKQVEKIMQGITWQA